MNLFTYTFFETALSSKYILWSSYLVLLCVIYIFVMHVLVGQQVQHDRQKKSFEGSVFQKTKTGKQQRSLVPKRIIFRKLFHLYAQAELAIPYNFFIGGSVLFILIAFFWGLKILNSISFAFFLALLVGLLLYLFLIVKAGKRKKKLVEQLPSFLQAMASTLQAGYSIPNSLEFLENEIELPLQQEIKRINQKRALKISLEKSLSDFAMIVDHPEIYFFAESTIIQLKTGGNLIKLFKKISNLIEEKLKLERDMKSFTSQGKLSGMLIALLWPISLLFFYFFSPQHTDVLFHTPAGKGLLVFSLLLEGLGFFFIWRIVKVRI